MGPLLPNATAFNYIFLTGIGLAFVAMLVTLLIKGPVKMEQPEDLLAVEKS
jgi:hypothetical protein